MTLKKIAYACSSLEAIACPTRLMCVLFLKLHFRRQLLFSDCKAIVVNQHELIANN